MTSWSELLSSFQSCGLARFRPTRAGEVRAVEVREGEGRVGEVLEEQRRAGEVRVGEVRLGEDRFGEARAVEVVSRFEPFSTMINFCPPSTPITARRALKNALQSRRV